MGNAGDVVYHCPQCGRTLSPGAGACVHCGWTLTADRLATASADMSEVVHVKSPPSLTRGARDDEQGLWIEPAVAGLWLAAIVGVLVVNKPYGFLVALVSGWFLVLASVKRERKGCLFVLGLSLMIATGMGVAIMVAFFMICMGIIRGVH